MRILRASLAVPLALAACVAAAAEVSLVTIADGNARVLRGSVWYKLAAGAPFQDGDVIEAGERTTVQVELATGATLNLVGPGAIYGASAPAAVAKDPSEFGLDRGWLKVVSAGPGVRLRTAVATATLGDAIVVAHQDGKLFEMFVETGAARLSEAGRIGRDGPAHDAKAGEYWARDGDKPFTSERRAPVKFVASMPRALTDKLASLAAKFKAKKPPPLAVDREITLAEADPWLTGPYRRTFARRLTGRLADPTFRKAVEANIAAYPDFDRVLHPEKYPAGAGTPTQAAPGTPPTPGTAPPAATPPAPAAKSAAPPAPPPASPPAKAGTKTGALWWSFPAASILFSDVPEAVL